LLEVLRCQVRSRGVVGIGPLHPGPSERLVLSPGRPRRPA
jgi:hypothetical protein